MSGVLELLEGGDRRSIGRSNEVVARVLKKPTLVAELVEGLTHSDPIVRMRSADALEKATLQHPEWLQPHKPFLLNRIARVEQQEVRWHMAQMIPRLRLSPKERARAFQILMGYLDDESRIVKTFAMQALADLASVDASLRPKAIDTIKKLTKTGSPAMKSRGRKLVAFLETD